jgi:molybdopterin biosynthesis enzyme MoaB
MESPTETPEVRETRSRCAEEDEYGNCIASLRSNLKKTPLERLIIADEYARAHFRLRNAARKRTTPS